MNSVHVQCPILNAANKHKPYPNPCRNANNNIPETNKIRRAENAKILLIILLGFSGPSFFIETPCHQPNKIPVVSPKITQPM